MHACFVSITVCVCVCVCMRACVCVCVRVCVIYSICEYLLGIRNGNTFTLSCLMPGIQPSKRTACCSAWFWINWRIPTILLKLRECLGCFPLFPCSLGDIPLSRKCSLMAWILCLLTPCKKMKVFLFTLYDLCIRILNSGSLPFCRFIATANSHVIIFTNSTSHWPQQYHI